MVDFRLRKRPRWSSDTNARAALFDDLVGAGDYLVRDRKAERLGGLEIDDQFIFGRLLHRQIGRVGTFENFVDVGRRAAMKIVEVCSITHETARLHINLEPKYARQAVLERKLRQSRAPSNSERRCYVEKTLDTFLYHLRKDPVEILGIADRHHVERDTEH